MELRRTTSFLVLALSVACGLMNQPTNQPTNQHQAWCTVYAVYGDAFTGSTEVVSRGPPVVRKSILVEELKAKLRRCRTITYLLGKTEEVNHDEPRPFRRLLERYMDSHADVTGCSYWPIVRMVQAWGRDWDVLKPGSVLVDAPGVNDSNGARDRVVRQHLKKADSVWIVSNISKVTLTHIQTP